MTNTNTRKLIYTITCVAMNVALITICSWISIPYVISFTMQTFAIFLISALFSWKVSILSVLAYILLGMVGVPVFTGFRAGAAAILGTTGGYIVGFLFTALIVSLGIRALGRKPWVMIVSMLAGLFVCYAFGTAWYMVLYIRNNGAASLTSVLFACVFPFILPDCVKILLATFLARRIYPHLPPDLHNKI